MDFEVHYTRKIEADDFFEAAEIAKKTVEDIEEVISICPFIEEDIIEMK